MLNIGINELDDHAARLALAGLKAIVKHELAQQLAMFHRAEADKFGELLNQKQAALARARQGVEVTEGLGRHSRVITATGLQDEVLGLARKRQEHLQIASELANSPMPGPDIIPGLAAWLAAHSAELRGEKKGQ